ncbi:hypothetical protein ACOSP7_017415 [Xanthoceras sorbifolium]
MLNMGTEDEKAATFPDLHHQHNSDTEVVSGEKVIPYSGPLSRPRRKSSGFNIPPDSTSSSSSHDNEDPYVEITLDVRDDSISVHSVTFPDILEDPEVQEDPELAVNARGLEEESSAPSRSSLVRNVSVRITHVFQELKLLTSFPKEPPAHFDKTKYAATAHALEGVESTSKTVDEAGSAAGHALKGVNFGECIGMNDANELALFLFDALALKHKTHRIWITKFQLRKFWDQICNKTVDFKFQTSNYKVNADGLITREEVKRIIHLSGFTNKLPNIHKQAEEYAALIMEELDPNGLGYITIDRLEKLLLQAPNQLVEGGGRRKLSKMLSQKMKNTQIHNPIRRCYHSTKHFLIDNWQRVWVMALWIWLMVGLFTYKYVQYRQRAAYEVMGHCVCIAKGAAETLKFNMALILLPVCRNTITWLRNQTKLGVVLPFDDNLNFHKVIAIGISIGTGIHVISYLACNFPRLLKANEDKYELMEPFFGEQPKSYWHFVKSVEVITGIIMVVLMTIAFILATSLFRQNKLNLPNLLMKFIGFNAF